MNTPLTLRPIKLTPSDGLFRAVSALALLLALTPLLLTSREMWDGVIGSYALTTADPALLSGWLLDSKWYLSYGLLRSASALDQLAGWPVWLSLKLWSCLMILGIGRETARLSGSLFDLPVRTARWALPLVVSFPVWFVFFSYSSMIGHLTSVWLGLAGYRWLRSTNRYAVAAGAVSVLASYQLASNCTFLPMLALAFYIQQPDARRLNAQRLVFMTVAAVAVFGATRVVWPPFGHYAGYNALLSPLSVASWVQYLKSAVLFATWLLLLAPAVITFLVTRQSDKKAPVAAARIDQQPNGIANRRTAVLLAALLLAAAAPYIGVGIGGPLLVPNLGDAGNSLSTVMTSGPYAPLLGPRYSGWGARHMLLALVPLTMLTLWIARATPNIRIAGATLAACVAFNLCWLVPGHWAKLRRHAQEQVMLDTLRSLPAPPAGKVNLLMPADVSYLNNLYEANYLLFLAYGRNEWAAYSAPNRPEVLKLMEEDRESILQKPFAARQTWAAQSLMKDFDWNRNCTSVLKLDLPALSVSDILWSAAHRPQSLPKADIKEISSTCPDGVAPWR